jgi:hypothetical protein
VPVAGPGTVFLVAAGQAGAAGETVTALLGPAPWDWTAVAVRGAVWGAAATLLAGWLRLRAPEVLAGLSGPGSAALAVLSFLTALGMLAVAADDPLPGGPALGALALAGAGVAWVRTAAGRGTAGRSGSA